MQDMILDDDALEQALRTELRREPAGPCLAQYRQNGELYWRSRGEVLGEAARIGGRLLAAGLRRGEPAIVAPVADGEVDTAGLVLACFLIGVPPLVLPAIDSGYGAQTDLWRHVFGVTESRVVLIGSDAERSVLVAAGLLEAIGAEADCLGLAALRYSPVRLLVAPRENLVARCNALQLTSGTTGSNHVCVWHGGAMLRAATGVATAMALDPGDRLFNWSGLHHTVGLLNTFIVGLVHGIPIVFMSPQCFAMDPLHWLSGITKSGATVTAAPNFALRAVARCMSNPRAAHLSLSHLRAIWNTGERILPTNVLEVAELLRPIGLRPEALRSNYGMAENTGGATFTSVGPEPLRIEVVAVNELETALIARPPSIGERSVEIASVGAPWPGLTVEILDESGEQLPDGRVGHVILRSPSRFEGYLRDPAATAAIIDGDCLLTGDLGYLRDGELFWTGRRSDIINVRGRKIDPDEFADVVKQVEEIVPGRYAAFGIGDIDRGTERVVVIVEVPAGTDRKRVAQGLRRAAALRLGIEVGDVVTVPPGRLEPTMSGKRRHRYYKRLYEAGSLTSD
jgi:fatty-acyl-CoA synthase